MADQATTNPASFSTAPANPNKTGTGFTNLQQYIAANPQNQLGSTVAGGIQQAGQQASGALQQAGQQFGQAIGAEQNREQQAYGQAQSAIGQAGQGTLQGQDVTNFQNVLQGQYLGPQGYTNTQGLQTQAQTAEKLGQAYQTQAGRYGLLQRFVGQGQPNYGIGAQSLDQLLLGQAGPQLQQAASGVQGLGQQAQRQIGAAGAQSALAQSQAQQLGGQLQQQLGQSVSDYNRQMAENLANYRAQAQSVINNLAGSTGNAPITLDPNVLNQLAQASGGLLKQGTQLYKADISPYVQVNTLYNTPQAVQTQADYQRISDLARLAGQTGLAGTSAASLLQSYVGNPAAVGQYQATNPFMITNQTSLGQAINKAQQDYQTALNAANQRVEGLTRDLGIANLDQYNVTGGALANLLRQYYGGQQAQNIQSQIGNLQQANQNLGGFSGGGLTPTQSAQLNQLQQQQAGPLGNQASYNTIPASLQNVLNQEAVKTDPNRYSTGQQYLNQMYAPIQGDIQAALTGVPSTGVNPYSYQASLQNVKSLINQLQSAEQAQAAAPGQFNFMRVLQTANNPVHLTSPVTDVSGSPIFAQPATPVTATPIQGPALT